MSGPSIMIMAGGTGGHVYPGLAVAAVLAKCNVEVNWLGSANSFESKLIPTQQLNFHAVNVAGLRGKGIMQKLAAPWMLARAVMQALTVFRRIRPRAAISFGGFAAGPGGIAATLLRVPLYVHEQNQIPGITNRVLAKFARRVLCGFPGSFTRSSFTGGSFTGGSFTGGSSAANDRRMDYIGNPVRAEIIAIEAPTIRFQDRSGPLRLLCLGGSLGANALNELLPQAIALLPETNRPTVRHQAGPKLLDSARACYQQAGLDAAQVVPFISDMADAYSWADVVICRAGALTVAELAAAGAAAILVPYPHAVDDHQTANAQFLVDAGAACMVQQRDLDPAKLAQLISQHSDRNFCLARAQSARNVARTDAAERCVQIILGTP